MFNFFLVDYSYRNILGLSASCARTPAIIIMNQCAQYGLLASYLAKKRSMLVWELSSLGIVFGNCRIKAFKLSKLSNN